MPDVKDWCPINVCVQRPSLISHTRIVVSKLPLTTISRSLSSCRRLFKQVTNKPFIPSSSAKCALSSWHPSIALLAIKTNEFASSKYYKVWEMINISALSDSKLEPRRRAVLNHLSSEALGFEKNSQVKNKLCSYVQLMYGDSSQVPHPKPAKTNYQLPEINWERKQSIRKNLRY